jgi:hypothetical protein
LGRRSKCSDPENGISVNVALGTFDTIAKVLGVHPRELIK